MVARAPFIDVGKRMGIGCIVGGVGGTISLVDGGDATLAFVTTGIVRLSRRETDGNRGVVVAMIGLDGSSPV